MDAPALRPTRLPPRPILAALLLLALAAGTARADGLPERCRLKPVNGNCKAMMERYRFDERSGRCVAYFYDGCGPVVPFETLEECRALCETPPAADNAAGAAFRLLEQLAASLPEPAPPEPDRCEALGRTLAGDGVRHDPVEKDPRYADVFRTIDDEVEARLAGHPQKGAMGFVHVYWGEKKALLKSKHGIDWCSPGELNPHVIFD